MEGNIRIGHECEFYVRYKNVTGVTVLAFRGSAK